MYKYDHKSVHTIANELHHDRRNVQRLISKYKQTGTVERQSGQGRKRKLTKDIERRMVKQAKSGKSSRIIARNYNQKQEKEATTVSAVTVRRTLKRAGLKYRSVTPRDELTTAQMKKRLAYAHDRLHYDWRNVVFTDEKTFPMGASEKRHGKAQMREKHEKN